MQYKKIAFIGAGNMAFALISGLLKSGYPAELICACNKSNQTRRDQLKALGVTVNFSNLDAVEWAEVVVLAVKPQIMASVCAEFTSIDFRDKWIISLAAGISVDRLAQLFPTAKEIIRSMPNTPSLIGEGIAGLFAKKSVNLTACQFAQQLLSAVGKYYWVENEAQLNQIIAITGSSPAYFFKFMEAMQQCAVQMGFSEADARLLVQSAALGAAKMVEQHPNLSIATLRENVTSKGGTTAQALAVFEQHQLNQSVHQAMYAAIERAEEMEASL